MRNMKWRFDGAGEWESFSVVGDQSQPAMWKVQVTEDGLFSVNGSDKRLMERSFRPFSSLRVAKEFCAAGEIAFVVRQSKSQMPLSIASCENCGDMLHGHEDESRTHCRFCVTSQPVEKSSESVSK